MPPGPVTAAMGKAKSAEVVRSELNSVIVQAFFVAFDQ